MLLKYFSQLMVKWRDLELLVMINVRVHEAIIDFILHLSHFFFSLKHIFQRLYLR